MAIAGSWRAGAVTPAEYVGATRWGTGINPIHAVRDEGPGRGPSKEPLGSTSAGDAIDPGLLDAQEWGYAPEDATYTAGEDYRYLANDHAPWGDGTVGRADRGPVIMSEGSEPGPVGFPHWGPHGARGNRLAAWPGGASLRAVSEGSDVEQHHAIGVPSPGWSGGWLNKAHGAVDTPSDAGPGQVTVTTSERQVTQTRVNDAAVSRETDDPRAPIHTRLTGQKVRVYAQSSGMGGGPGTPDMAPQTQDLPFRPWFYRSAGLPPSPDTTYGTMTGTTPLERVPPADAGELVTTTETGLDVTYTEVADQDYYA